MYGKDNGMENVRDEEIKKLTEKLQELQDEATTSNLVKNNVNEFMYKDKVYRVHLPVAFEKDLLTKERMKKYIEFLKDPMYMFRNQLISLLKTKGVDILKMEREIEKLYGKEKELLKRLAISEEKDDITTLKSAISDLRYETQQIYFERDEYLKFCIEKQLEDAVRLYLVYLVLEVKNGETWEKAYKTYDEFEKSDDDIMLGRAAQILSVLVYNDKL
jgi:hypothetical protein